MILGKILKLFSNQINMQRPYQTVLDNLNSDNQVFIIVFINILKTMNTTQNQKYGILFLIFIFCALFRQTISQQSLSKTLIYSSVNSMPAHYKQVTLQAGEKWLFFTKWTGSRADFDMYVYSRGSNPLQSQNQVIYSASWSNNPQTFLYVPTVTGQYVIHYVLAKYNDIDTSFDVNCSAKLLTDSQWRWTQIVTFPKPSVMNLQRQFTVPANCPVIQIEQSYQTQKLQLFAPGLPLSSTPTLTRNQKYSTQLIFPTNNNAGVWNIRISNSTTSFNTHTLKMYCINEKCNDNIKMGSQSCDSVIDAGCVNCAVQSSYTCSEDVNLLSTCITD